MKAKSARSKVARLHTQDALTLKKSSLFVAIASLLGSHAAAAGPEGGQIVNGTGSIVQTDPSSTLITQGSERLGIDWQSFNVAEHESVRFDQPNSSSVALNRIFDQNPSMILGALDANGHVFLINPNGMVFGEGAQINVAGLVASSLDLSQEDFAGGQFNFTANGASGLVVNRGLIQAATGGSVSLLGGAVANEGVIVAELGQVNLAAGTQASLDFSGDGLLFFEVSGELLTNGSGAGAAVSNSGTIQANGGSVLLTAAAARGVFSSVVNNQGLVSATRIENNGGVIRLVGEGGDVITSGTLDASGQGGAGGTVQVLGDRVALAGSAVVDVSGDTGGGSAQIGGSFQGSDPSVKNAEATFVGAGTRIDASAGDAGDGGDVIVWADGITRFNGEIAARGGASQGDGGFVEVSGKETLVFRGRVDASAPNGTGGTLLLDPLSIRIEGGEDDDDVLDDGVVNFADDPDDAEYTIYEESLEEIAAGTIVLEATQSITASATNTFTFNAATQGDGFVVLQDDVNLVMRTSNEAVAGVIDIDGDTANSPLTFRTGGAGTIEIEAGDELVGVESASLFAGNLETAGGTITLSARENVTVNDVNADTGAVEITIGTDGEDGRTLTIGDRVRGSAAGSRLRGGEDAADSVGHTLVAGRGPDSVILDATNTLNGVAFQDFDIVNAGDGGDNFAILASYAGVLDGGEGSDTFTVGAGGELSFAGVALTGGADLDGTADDDMLSVAGKTGTLTVSLTDAAADGFAGSAATVFTGAGGGFAAIDTLAGSADTLEGLLTPDTSSTWTRVPTPATPATYADGADVLTFSGFATAVGRAATDVLQGNDAVANVDDDEFTVGATGVTLNGQLFQQIETLSGRGGADDFALNASFGGAINGDAGDDDFELGAGVTAPSVQGGADSDEVIAASATTFTLTGADTGTAVNGGTVTFSGIDTVTGSGDADSFAINASFAGVLDGGEGSDTFTVGAAGALSGAGVALTGGADLAADDNDTLDVSAKAAAVVSLADAAATGFAGSATTVFTGGGTFAAIDNLVGGADDTLQGLLAPDTSSTWTRVPTLATPATYADGADELTFSGFGTAVGRAAADVLQGNDALTDVADDTFTITAANVTLNTQVFTNIETLSGRGGADTFHLNGSFGGVIAGDAGSDDFQVAAGVTAANVQGGAGSDEVIAAGATTFTLTAADAGTAQNGGTVTFTSVENLTGSIGDDDFNLNFSLTGTAAGGAGDDRFDLAAAVNATVAGGDGTDSVFGAASSTTFTVAGAGVGTAANGGGAVQFSTVENLTGGAAVDIFNLNANLGGTADGAGENDVFNLNADQTGTANGGAGNDQFTLAAAVTGTVVGGDGADTLTASSSPTTFLVTGTNAGTAANGGESVAFSTIETLAGGAGNDVFNINAASAMAMSGNAGDDAFAINATQTGVLDGGEGSDTFTVGAAGTLAIPGVALTGGVDAAGNDVDTLNVAAKAAALTLSLASSVANEGFSGTEAAVFTGGSSFAAIDSIVGSADRLQGRAVASTWTPTTYSDGTETLAFSGIAVAEGRAAADALQGTAGDDVFTVGAPGAVTLTGQAFEGIDSLSGLGGADDFNLNANFGGAVSGGDGTDEFFVNATQTVALAGDAGDDDFRLGAGVTATVQGGAGSDEIVAAASATNFALTAADAGTAQNGAGTVTFSAVENLTGNIGNDDFDLNFNLSGTAAGGAGNDRFDLAAGVTATVAGGADTDSVFGAATATTFNVTGAGAGSLTNGAGTVQFSTVENLTGGAAADTFNLNANLGGTADGAGENDVFNLNADQTGTANGAAGDDRFNLAAAVTGTVVGGDGADTLAASSTATTFTVAGVGAGTAASCCDSVAFSTIETLAGGTGADVFNLNANFGGAINAGGGTDAFFINATQTGTLAGDAGNDDFQLGAGVSATVQGGGGFDEIIAAASATTFALTADNEGTAKNGAGTVTFTAVENLTGNTANDDFDLNFNLTGTAAGGGGDDRFDLAAAVNATVAGGSGTDSLFGAATATTFTVSGAEGAGSVTNGGGTVQFSTIENLTGGAAVDTFKLNANLAGTADGVGGNDVFSLDADQTGTANGGAGDDAFTLGAGVAGTVVGGDGNDTLGAPDSATTFTVTAANAGNATNGGDSVAFSSIETLAGAAGDDTFVVNTSSAMALIGNAGNDTFVVNASSTTAMTGNAGNDTFDIANGIVAGGALDGGAGSDTLTLSRFTTARSVALTAAGADGFNGSEQSVTQGFRNIDVITGGQAPDTLTGLNAAATWTLGDAGNTYAANGGTLTFSSFGTLNGGSASDAFVLNNGSHSGNLELIGNGGANKADVVGSYIVTGDLTLRGIQTIRDTSGGTTLTAGTLTLDGATDVGLANNPLFTRVQNLVVENGGNMFLTEKDGLNVLRLDAGSGNFRVTVENGNLSIGPMKAGGKAELVVLQGNILDTNGESSNIDASSALLDAPNGIVGTSDDKLEITVPAGSFIDVRTKDRVAGAFITASTGSRLRIDGREFIIGPAGVTTPESLATNNTLLVDVSAVDWASLNPMFTLFDCLEPCARLPADQDEGEELAEVPRQDPMQTPGARLLLIRTSFGWKMVPVVPAAETAALRE